MSAGSRVRRWLGAALLALAASSTAHVAFAKPSKEVAACYDDFERSQELRREHRLVEARAALTHCAVKTCPVAVSRPCEKWLAEVNATVPSVVVRAETGAGEPIEEGTLSIDGNVRGELPMVSLALDPGEHTFVLRRAGETVARATIVLAEGDRDRDVLLRGLVPTQGPAPVTPVALPAAPIDRPRRGLTAAPIALFATSALGLGVFAVVGAGTRSDAADLRSRCSPRCASGDVDPLRTRALIADVGLGIGVVSAAAGLYLALSRVDRPKTAGRPLRWAEAALSRIVAGPRMVGVVTSTSF